jgi:hypothetical protein
LLWFLYFLLSIKSREELAQVRLERKVEILSVVLLLLE